MRWLIASRLRSLSCVGLAGIFLAAQAQAEEGFWLFTAPPMKAIQRDHRQAPSRALLDHLMRSTAKFDSGFNSGSFVSADGLLLTNWHIGKAFVRRMTNGARYMREGYLARTPAEELRLDPKDMGC